MKKLLITLLTMCAAQIAWADDEMVTLIDTTPSQFAQAFNRFNQSDGHGVYKNIRLTNTYGERVLKLRSGITLTVGAHEDGIEYIDLICKNPKQTIGHCIMSMPWIANSVDSSFNQYAFMEMVSRNLETATEVVYRQNGIEYNVVTDVKRQEMRMEIQALD